MSLFGGTTINESKPKWLTEKEKNEIFATENGWEKYIPNSGIPAVAQINVTAIPLDGDTETVTVGTQVYTFTDSISSANDVNIGASATTARNNLVNAINRTGISGTDYHASTKVNVDAIARIINGGDNMKLFAKSPGVSGNSLVLSVGGTTPPTVVFGFVGGENAKEIIVAINNLKSSLTGLVSATITGTTGTWLVGDLIFVEGLKQDAIFKVATVSGADIATTTMINRGSGFSHSHTFVTSDLTTNSVAGTGLGIASVVLEGPQITDLEINSGRVFADSVINVATDQTADAKNISVLDDVTPFSVGTLDTNFFIGSSKRFNSIEINSASQPGTLGVVRWQYWSGTAWNNLEDVVDPTNSFTVSGTKTITFVEPFTWHKKVESSSASLFFVRANLTKIYGVDPLIDQIKLGGKGFSNTDNIDIEVTFNEEVKIVKSGNDPHLVMDLLGNDPILSKTFIVTASGTSNKHIFRYVAETEVPGTTSNDILVLDDGTTPNPLNTETVTINGRVYTFKTTLTTGTEVADEVLIGAAATDTRDNLVAAINTDSANSGTLFSANTPFNTDVIASAVTTVTAKINAIKDGTTVLTTSDGIAATGNTWDTNNAGTNGVAVAKSKTQAKGHLTFLATVSDGEVVVIDSQSYTFKTVLTSPEVANEVLIGGSVSASRTNLNSAINGIGTSGTDYSSLTLINSAVTSVVSGNVLIITAKIFGILGNSIASTSTMAGDQNIWNGATLSTANDGEFVVNGTSIVPGAGSIKSIVSKGKFGIKGKTILASGTIATYDFNSVTGGPDKITLVAGSSPVWSLEIGIRSLISVSGTVSNNGQFKVLRRVSDTVIEVDYKHSLITETGVAEADVTMLLDSDEGLGVGVASDVNLTSSGATNTSSSGLLTITGNPVSADTVTIDGVVYRWRTKAEGLVQLRDVLIGVSPTTAEHAFNLMVAINAETAHQSSKFAFGTPPHQTVRASLGATTNIVKLEAVVPGVVGNVITTTESSANMTFGAATLENGVNGSVNLKTAFDLTEISVN